MRSGKRKLGRKTFKRKLVRGWAARLSDGERELDEHPIGPQRGTRNLPKGKKPKLKITQISLPVKGVAA